MFLLGCVLTASATPKPFNLFIDAGFGICVFALFDARSSFAGQRQKTYVPVLPDQSAGLLPAHRARNPHCALSHGARPDGLDKTPQ